MKSEYKLILGAFAIYWFFIREKPHSMDYLGYQDGYEGIPTFHSNR